MVLFKISYDVTANTASTSLDRQILKICKGKIIGWIVYMPEQAANLLRLRIEYHGTQIFPFTRNEYAYGLFTPVMIPEDINIETPPFELDIYSYNDDDTYNHEYNVNVVITPSEEIQIETPATSDWFNKIKSLFGV